MIHSAFEGSGPVECIADDPPEEWNCGIGSLWGLTVVIAFDFLSEVFLKVEFYLACDVKC